MHLIIFLPFNKTCIRRRMRVVECDNRQLKSPIEFSFSSHSLLIDCTEIIINRKISDVKLKKNLLKKNKSIEQVSTNSIF